MCVYMCSVCIHRVQVMHSDDHIVLSRVLYNLESVLPNWQSCDHGPQAQSFHVTMVSRPKALFDHGPQAQSCHVIIVARPKAFM